MQYPTNWPITGGTLAAEGLTASTVVKSSPGRVATVTVLVAGSAAGAIYDSASLSGNTAANQVAVVPNTVGVYTLNWPTNTGITYIVGTGQTVSIAYS